jgi:branched-chain amino acid transport system permease protein
LTISLVYAVARFPNAAAGDIMTVGAYAGIGVQLAGGASVLLQGAAAIAACIAVSLICHILVFRRLRGRSMVAPLLASIGLAFFVRAVLSFFFGQDQYVFKVPFSRPLVLAGVRLQPADLWIAATVLLCMGAVFIVLFLTPIGRRMRAIADNPDLARASGIRAGRVMIVLWSLVGVVAAIAGIVLGLKTVVAPEMGWALLLPTFAASVLGGIGNPVGAVLAGIVLGIAQELSTPFLGFTYKIALSFIVMAGILALRPQGLLGVAERIR